MAQPTSAPYPSWTTLRAVAAAQRRVVLLFLVGIALNVLGQGVMAGLGTAAALIGTLFILAFLVALVVSVHRLAKALGSSAPWLWAGACWLSLLGLILILVLNGRATRLLKRSGIKVGFLGVTLPAAPPPGVITAEVADVFS